ncbi:MAG: MarR family winged helix-turn-helix transcriptional regulator, partial [Paracoccaceae bacterium]
LVNQDSNNISRTLGLLEARGFVRRIKNPSDRRSQSVEITEEGAAAHEKAFIAIQEYWQASFRGFSEEEIEMLSELMQRMTENLEDFLHEPSS